MPTNTEPSLLFPPVEQISPERNRFGQEWFRQCQNDMGFVATAVLNRELARGNNSIKAESITENQRGATTRYQEITVPTTTLQNQPIEIIFRYIDPAYLGSTPEQAIQIAQNTRGVNMVDIRFRVTKQGANGQPTKEDQFLFWENTLTPGRINRELITREPSTGKISLKLEENESFFHSQAQDEQAFDKQFRDYAAQTFGFVESP